LLGIIWLVVLSWPDSIQQAKDPSWLDSIFASKPVLFAARLLLFAVAVVLVFGGVYTVVSIISWMQRGHWLRRIGPFEVAEQAISELTTAIDDWKGLAKAAQLEIDDLKEELAQTQALADHFYERWQESEAGPTTEQES
jgi:hypothetical protein